MPHTLLFRLLCFCRPQVSLAYDAWKRVEQKRFFADLRRYRHFRNATHKVNSPILSIFIVFSVLVICTTFALLHCERYESGFLSNLQIFHFPNDRGYDLIEENLGAAATIVGLSFVVIGFLLETIKDKTQADYRLIFKISFLYYVFSIAIVGLFFLGFFTLIRYAVNTYQVGNLAVLSSYILLSITVSIGIMFFLFLRLFRPGAFNDLQNLALIKSFSKALMIVEFEKQCASTFTDMMKEMQVELHRETFISPVSPRSWLTGSKRKSGQVVDVYMPLIKWVIGRLRKKSVTITYSYLPFPNSIHQNHEFVSVDITTPVSEFLRMIFRNSIAISTVKTNSDFDTKKETLGKRFVKSIVENSDEVFDACLADIELLYNYYYHINYDSPL